MTLNPVDRIEILTVIDNYVDVLLTNGEVVTRPPLAKSGTIPTDTLLAEHGLCLRVTVQNGEARHHMLFDTGYSRVGVPHNLDQLGLDLSEIEAVALSHGHMDHTGGVYTVLSRVGKRVPLVVHPEAFLSRRFFGLTDGRKLLFPRTLIREDLDQQDVDLMAHTGPTGLTGDRIMVTGRVDRVTDFETGLPNAVLERDGRVEKDDILDDQALVVHLKGKGLVVISGCSHAGIINTILYARKLTGIQEVYAVLGGFHLSGPFFEKIIEQTIEAFKEIGPEILAPMHCTGWKAIGQIARTFPEAFVLNSVGATITLQ